MSSSNLNNDPNNSSAAPLGVLRQFARKRDSSGPPAEHCDLCSEVIPSNHRHLLDLSSGALLCSCQACSLLFYKEGAAGGKYRLIPTRYLSLPDFQMTDLQWEDLALPVNMVFIFRSTGAKRIMAFYPSPAGAMESMLPLEGWEALATANSILNDLAPDVEALLINRVNNAREYYIVPIDACYQLVGLIRTSWRGLSGGTEVWDAIADFFKSLQAKSEIRRGEANARPEL